jgi:hypothetical protein
MKWRAEKLISHKKRCYFLAHFIEGLRQIIDEIGGVFKTYVHAYVPVLPVVWIKFFLLDSTTFWNYQTFVAPPANGHHDVLQ